MYIYCIKNNTIEGTLENRHQMQIKQIYTAVTANVMDNNGVIHKFNILHSLVLRR